MLRTTYKHSNNHLLKSKEALRVSRAVTWLTVYRPLDTSVQSGLTVNLGSGNLWQGSRSIDNSSKSVD